MRKYSIVFFITILFTAKSFACDICGCGVGNYYLGLLPHFKSSFLGVRYQFSSFRTNITGDATQYSKDFFQTTEIWGGVSLGRRWQLLALLPFNIVHQKSDDGTLNRSGFGDIALMANYKVFEHASVTESKKLITQQVWLGGGIKLATGKFNADQTASDLAAIANTQVGSGSTDFILNAMYNIGISRFGLNNSLSYKINTTNNNQYFFGNKFTANSIAYYTFKKAVNSITPNAGLLYNHNDANKALNEKVAQTGGYLLTTMAGVEVGFKKFTIGSNVQLPIAQNFASGQTNTKVKGMLHITFVL